MRPTEIEREVNELEKNDVISELSIIDREGSGSEERRTFTDVSVDEASLSTYKDNEGAAALVSGEFGPALLVAKLDPEGGTVLVQMVRPGREETLGEVTNLQR